MAVATKTFESWMARVDAVLAGRVGVSSADLPDCCYRDWYEDGWTVTQAAARAMRMADGGDE